MSQPNYKLWNDLKKEDEAFWKSYEELCEETVGEDEKVKLKPKATRRKVKGGTS